MNSRVYLHVPSRQVWARGIALFFGAFTLLNFAGELFHSGFNANAWWINLRWLPGFVAKPFLIVAGVALLSAGLGMWRLRKATGVFAGLLMFAALVNSVDFYLVLAHGGLHTAIPVPLSLFVAAALGLVTFECWRPDRSPPRKARLLPAFAVAGACALSLPFALMVFFGKSDYSRKADVAVVLGSRAYADGRPSRALADRVRTACDLYERGLVGKLLFSGGPGDGAVHETEAMRRMAMTLGVPDEDILLDANGNNTRATVINTLPMLEQLHASRVLVVSHFYHLPRIKLEYQRHHREVLTVPARETQVLGKMPYYMAREVAAFWAYYIRG